MLQNELKKRAIRQRRAIIDLLSDLIAIPTANPPGQAYKECVNYLSQRLKEWGIKCKTINVPNGNFPRFSLIGSIGKGQRTLHFHGHYDVVPAQSSHQYHPRLKEDRLWGRGASDMKGGLVSMLLALGLIQECASDFDGRITFSVVPDEETGGDLGTNYLFDQGLLPPSDCIGMLMPEPTNAAIWNANKGALTLKITIKGKSAHVGLAHQGVNTFEQLVEVAQALLELKKNIGKRKTLLPVTPPEANRSVMLIGGESGSGVSFNMVPETAFFTVDRRFNPEESLEGTKQELVAILDHHRSRGFDLAAETLQEGESSVAETNTSLASALSQSIQDVTGKIPRFELCPGLCEIRFFNNRAIPAYAYGPGILEVSHGPNEYIKINDILNCAAIYALTADRLLKKKEKRPRM
jgi:succinyl-diaminopimelate desuccinylase